VDFNNTRNLINTANFFSINLIISQDSTDALFERLEFMKRLLELTTKARSSMSFYQSLISYVGSFIPTNTQIEFLTSPQLQSL
jgi:hypothetical protein